MANAMEEIVENLTVDLGSVAIFDVAIQMNEEILLLLGKCWRFGKVRSEYLHNRIKAAVKPSGCVSNHPAAHLS